MNRAIERELTRRGLLAAGTVGLLGLSGALRALEAVAADTARAAVPRSAAPAEAVRTTMTAFADTIIPGPAGGASSTPGAVEAGAVEEIYDPFYGVADAFPVLHADIQAATARIVGRPVAFDLDLPYEQRELVVLDRMAEPADAGQDPLYIGYGATAVLVYLAYVGTARSRVGPETMGFPPFSDGYFPGHSYRVRFRRMTRDGNPR